MSNFVMLLTRELLEFTTKHNHSCLVGGGNQRYCYICILRNLSTNFCHFFVTCW